MNFMGVTGMNEKDSRVIKTRHNIQNAMVSLLAEKPLEKISVQQILDYALINRTTFYKHYSDKYAVIEQLNNECIQIFKENIEERLNCFTETKAPFAIKIVEHLYNTFFDRKQMLLALFSIQNENFHLYNDMENLLKECFVKQYSETFSDSSELDYLSTIYGSLGMVSLKWYLEHDSTENIKRYFKLFQTEIAKVINEQ